MYRIVLKLYKAITDRNERDERLQNIAQLVHSVILLGTPHYGAGLGEWAAMSARALHLDEKATPGMWKQVRDLKNITDKQRMFREKIERPEEGSPRRGVRVTCFFESTRFPRKEPVSFHSRSDKS